MSSFRCFLPRPSDQRMFRELTLSHHARTGASAFGPDPFASGGGFRPLYNGADSVILRDEPHLLVVNLVRSNGSPVLTRHYIVEILPQPDLIFAKKHSVTPRR